MDRSKPLIRELTWEEAEKETSEYGSLTPGERVRLVAVLTRAAWEGVGREREGFRRVYSYPEASSREVPRDRRLRDGAPRDWCAQPTTSTSSSRPMTRTSRVCAPRRASSSGSSRTTAPCVRLGECSGWARQLPPTELREAATVAGSADGCELVIRRVGKTLRRPHASREKPPAPPPPEHDRHPTLGDPREPVSCESHDLC